MSIKSLHSLTCRICVGFCFAVSTPSFAFDFASIETFNCQSSGVIAVDGRRGKSWFKYTHITTNEFKRAEADAKRMNKAVGGDNGTYYWSTDMVTVNGSLQRLSTRVVKLSSSINGNSLITENVARLCDERDIGKCHPQILSDSDYVESIKILSPKGFAYDLTSFSFLETDVIVDLRFEYALETILKFDKAMQACHQ